MNALLHGTAADCFWLAWIVTFAAFNLAQWRKPLSAILGRLCLLAMTFWSYALVIDLAPDPPTIPCTQGMTLLPHQSCTLRIEISIPHPDGSI